MASNCLSQTDSGTGSQALDGGTNDDDGASAQALPSQSANIQLQANELLNLVDTAIKRRLEPVVQEIQMAKRPRKAYSFRYQGNEYQHKFNEDIRDQLSKATALIENEESLSGLHILGKIQKQLDKRNKLVRMADASECGWKTVEEYEDKGIGSDSDDEKKIRAAEDRARKKKRDMGSKGQGRFRFGEGRMYPAYQTSQNQPFQSSGGSSQAPPLFAFPQGWGSQNQPQFNQPGINYYANNQQGYGHGGQNARKDDHTTAKGCCFNCGSFGHWYQKCPMPKKN